MRYDQGSVPNRNSGSHVWLPLGWMTLALFLSGCAGVFYSALDQDAIRATAQDIATTRLATTVEVVVIPTLTLGPDAPTATVNVAFCPQDELGTWKEATLIDIKKLFSEVAIFNSNSYSAEQLNEIYLRARAESNSYNRSLHPKCTDQVRKRLANLYERFYLVIEAEQAGDPANVGTERTAFLKAKSKLTRELRDLLSDKDFKVFNAVIWKSGDS